MIVDSFIQTIDGGYDVVVEEVFCEERGCDVDCFIYSIIVYYSFGLDTIITMKLSNLLLALSLSLGLLGSIVVGQEAATVAEDAVTSTTTEEATIDLDEAAPEEAGEEKVKENVEETQAETAAPPVQSGPLVDLLGPSLFSLDMVDETHAQFVQHTTSDALRGKKVIGLYFSADW